jgi:hypothetical protein
MKPSTTAKEHRTMAKKDELIAKAVELELGSEEDIRALTIPEIEELLEENEPPVGDPEPEEPDETEPAEEPSPEPAAEKRKTTTVDDLVRMGRVKAAKTS